METPKQFRCHQATPLEEPTIHIHPILQATILFNLTYRRSGRTPLAITDCIVAADSDIATFTVTNELLTPIPDAPLPTEYWTRPINSYDRSWSQIAGNWITGDRGLPYITTPNSAHVMWTEPYFFGGIAGGEYEAISYHTGSAYEGKFGGATIISGRLFYNLNLGSSTTTTKANIVARDLRL